MRPILVVGDLQQAPNEEVFVRSLPYLYPDHELWFLGDIIDSFVTHPPEQVRTLRVVFDYIRNGIARCVRSNHDWQYVEPRMRCSGYNRETVRLFADPDLGNGLHDLVEPFIFEVIAGKSVLVSHAGLSAHVAEDALSDDEAANLTDLPTLLREWARDVDSPYYWIGRDRGGPDPVGGLLWCDWNREFEPIPGLIQVVGHSYSSHFQVNRKQWNAIKPRHFIQHFDGAIRISDGPTPNYNIDCLGKDNKNTILRIDRDTGVFSKVEVEINGR